MIHHSQASGATVPALSRTRFRLPAALLYLYIYMYTTSTLEKRKAMEATESLTEAARTPTEAFEVLVLPTEHETQQRCTSNLT